MGQFESLEWKMTFKMQLFCPFLVKKKIGPQLGNFLWWKAEIFISLLTFDADCKIALKSDIFFSVSHLELQNAILAIFQPIWHKFSPAS